MSLELWAYHRQFGCNHGWPRLEQRFGTVRGICRFIDRLIRGAVDPMLSKLRTLRKSIMYAITIYNDFGAAGHNRGSGA